jgi:Ca2+:H+ antiporter
VLAEWRQEVVMSGRLSWSNIAPVGALLVLVLEWGRTIPTWAALLSALVLGAAVMSGVHHAEVIAHRLGEPRGSLVLAVAVTVIEVGLILSVMAGGGPGADTLARNTVFAALMITLNGIVGLSIVVATFRERSVSFNAAGSGSALAAVTTLAVLSLVLPSVTVSEPGPRFTPAQLAFSAVTALGLWVLFVVVQTVRNRELFQPEGDEGALDADGSGGHEYADHMPTDSEARRSFVLLLVALVAVVGLAKVLSPTLERAVGDAGLPYAVVGVTIALLVLLPESISAVRSARRGRMQASMNLAYGSAMASIGLTIPCIAVASIWFDDAVTLGLSAAETVLLALSVGVGILTVTPGRATLLQGGVHLAIFFGFLVITVSP